MLRQFITLSLVVAVGVNGGAVSAEQQDSEMDAIQSAHFGRAVYSLYTQDPLASLSHIALAKHKGVSEKQRDTLDLLEGGIALSFDMPALAQHHLRNPSAHSDNQVLALHWLARLNFSQGRLQDGLATIEQLLTAANSSEITSLLTPAQWYELNYEGAQATLAMGNSNVEPFTRVIPTQHITQQYLQYNEGVLAFEQGNASAALSHFKQVERNLLVSRDTTSTLLSWFDWVKWWQLPEDHSVPLIEQDALLNQVYLTQGQLLLSQGKLASALNVLTKLDHTASNIMHRHDEILLNYAWGLAQSGDWPNAMGMWQYLSTQPVNMFTLQATHALAVGYAKHQGNVQAYETLGLLNQQIQYAIAQLEQLSNLINTDGYWHSVATHVDKLSLGENDASQTDSSTALGWPNAHQDILFDLLEGDHAALSLSNRFADLDSLYAIRSQLQQQQQTIAIYLQLLDERDATHQHRVDENANAPVQDHITKLTEHYSQLKLNVESANQQIVAATTPLALFTGLATFANESQLSGVNRLLSAQQIKTMLAQQRTLKPSYSVRLDRLMGILIWDLHEQLPKVNWDTHQQLLALAQLLEQANAKQARFTALLEQKRITDQERERVMDIAQRLQLHLGNTETLISSVESTLSKIALAVVLERKRYLNQQYHVNQLAMLQLKDTQLDESAVPSTMSVGGGNE